MQILSKQSNTNLETGCAIMKHDLHVVSATKDADEIKTIEDINLKINGSDLNFKNKICIGFIV